MLKHSPCRDGHRSIIVFFLAKKLKNERSDLWRIKQNRIHGSRLSAMPSQIILGLMLRIIAMYTPSAALPRNEALDPRKTLRSYTPLQAKTNAKNYARKFAALKECYKYAKRCQTCLFFLRFVARGSIVRQNLEMFSIKTRCLEKFTPR